VQAHADDDTSTMTLRQSVHHPSICQSWIVARLRRNERRGPSECQDLDALDLLLDGGSATAVAAAAAIGRAHAFRATRCVCVCELGASRGSGRHDGCHSPTVRYLWRPMHIRCSSPKRSLELSHPLLPGCTGRLSELFDIGSQDVRLATATNNVIALSTYGSSACA
jgi:hypothetical protein